MIKTDSAFAVGIGAGLLVPRTSKVTPAYLKNSLASGKLFDLMVIALLKGQSGLTAEKINSKCRTRGTKVALSQKIGGD